MAVAKKITKHEELRRKMGLTASAVAKRLNYSKPYITMVEHGRIIPSEKYKQAFAEIVQVPAKFIFDE